MNTEKKRYSTDIFVAELAFCLAHNNKSFCFDGKRIYFSVTDEFMTFIKSGKCNDNFKHIIFRKEDI